MIILNKKYLLYTFLSIFFILKVHSQQHFPIIIIGGGASGISAGIESSRSGINTLIIEETPWLGGMITSAGVSAFDGNHQIAGGIFKEFRDSLYNHYGGQKAVSTGWVSNTLFEPSIGNRIFKNIAKKEKKLSIDFNAQCIQVSRQYDLWNVTILNEGIDKKYTADIIIDATETGDIIQYLKIPADIGMESGLSTGESWAGETENDFIQDMTYVVILKDYGNGADKTITKPIGYDPKEFECCCDTKAPSINTKLNLECAKMMTYGKLPNGKYMINWPTCGNDIYLNILHDDRNTRKEKLKEAKLQTLRFVYYMQHELGYKHLGIADDEYPTEDLLPYIPYHRESRRIQGLARLQADHLVNPYTQKQKYYRTGITVGDYPIDHHHKKNPNASDLHFFNIKTPSYNVPMGCLIPKVQDGIIVAEKSISVSNIVNGTTRLQPVVLGIGQAAGAIATQCIKTGKSTHEISIRSVQAQLLSSGAYIMPYIDVHLSDPFFKEVQKIGATGILKGFGINNGWANQTWFYPKKILSESELLDGLKSVYPLLSTRKEASGDDLRISYFMTLLNTIQSNITHKMIYDILNKIKPGFYTEKTILNRYQVSILLDKLIDPFALPVDHDGIILHP